MILTLPSGARTWRDCTDLLPPADYRIGGTDAAAICGVSPYRSPWDVWRREHGTQVPADREPTPEESVAMCREARAEVAIGLARGRIAEPALLGWYEQEKRPLSGLATVRRDVIAVGPKPWMVATLDGLVPSRESPAFVVEAKTDMHREDRWPPDGASVYEAGAIPDDYWVQAMWYLACTGAEVCDFVVATRDRARWDPVIDTVAGVALSTSAEAAHELVDRWYAIPEAHRPPAPAILRTVRVWPHREWVDAVVDEVTRWRQLHLVEGRQPPVDGSDACRQTVREAPRAPRRVRATDTQAEAVRRVLAAREAAQQAVAEQRVAEAALMGLMDTSKIDTDDRHTASIDRAGRLTIT